MTLSLQVLVIGAGLGGLALAQGLRAADVDVRVFEADESWKSRPQGARIHIDDRGTRALRGVLPPALFDLFEATVGEPDENVCVLADVDGMLQIVAREPFTGSDDNPGQTRPGRPVSRRLLRDVLRAGLETRVRLGRRFVRYAHMDGRVRAYFADGGHADGDVLVGADGIGSAVRRQYLPHARVLDTGVRWLGGKTPLDDEVLATGLPEMIRGGFALTELDDAGMVAAVMRFRTPPRLAAAEHWPELEPSEVDDFVMWALILSPRRLDGVARGWSDEPSGVTDAGRLHRLARDLAGGGHPTLRTLVERAWPGQTYLLEMGTAAPMQAWPASAVTVLGDAVHAMPPNRGSGANTALQDAGWLARALATADRGQTTAVEAVAGYEAEMRRDAFASVRASVDGLGEFLLRE